MKKETRGRKKLQNQASERFEIRRTPEQKERWSDAAKNQIYQSRHG